MMRFENKVAGSTIKQTAQEENRLTNKGAESLFV